ncbi:MAG: hypothetical protein EKE12_00470 [Candidatus Symbiopectobacterium sp. Clec_Harlan]|nr:hypothetical protein [Candidatus Symbiopectobacterium sp. Clec_Harlan]
MSKGQTRLTLSVLANDFYHASTGYHDVLVFSHPLLSVGTVSYISRGISNTSGAWFPLFTDDNMSVPWSVDNANEFSSTRSVEISLKDASGSVLAQQTAASLTGPQTTTITPTANFWGKAATLTVVAQGAGALKTEFTKTVTIASAGIADVKDFASGVAQVGTTYSDGTYASYCRTTWLGSNWVNSVIKH